MATVTSLTDVIQTYISAHGKKTVYEHLEKFLGITIKKKRSKVAADGSVIAKRPMSAFAAFVKHLRETEGTDGYTAWKSIQTGPKKALWPGYASHVRTHRPAEWSEFESTFKAANPPSSSSASAKSSASVKSDVDDSHSVASSVSTVKPKKVVKEDKPKKVKAVKEEKPKAEKAKKSKAEKSKAEKPKKSEKAEKPKKVSKKAAKPAESDTESESDSETTLELIRIDGAEYYLNSVNNQIFAKSDTDKAIGTLNEDGDGINLFA